MQKIRYGAKIMKKLEGANVCTFFVKKIQINSCMERGLELILHM